MQLYNKIDKKVLEERLAASDEPRTTISFYTYHTIDNPETFRDHLYLTLSSVDVLGRIYVATEGINAQISVPTDKLEDFRALLYSIDWLDGCRLNLAVDDDGKSFIKLKILVRPKIVADGLNDATFDAANVGKYLKAKEFNELTKDPDTVLIDMRNHYESEVGHFKNAITPDVDTFRDSLPIIEEMITGKEDKNIVMYCTGGIRCEKASAYFKHKGFKKIHHLEGGIINYVKQVQEDNIENRFIGKNFVFDKRLGERISDDVIAVCHQCGSPCDTHVNCKNEACHLLFIQCDNCGEKLDHCCSVECQDFIQLPIEEQRELRKGMPARNVYKKGRSPKLKYKK
ncbi:MAG: rhodanese-related sulfurtransferase [Chitinophagales bacterium]